MASLDKLPIPDQSMGPPNFFPDTWLSEAYARDTNILTKVQQISISKDSNTSNTTNILSNYSPSLETPPLLCTNKSQLGIKRKLGTASKKRKSKTLYITVDVTNFRRLVQQVTGFKFGDSKAPVVPLLKPEPERSGCRFPGPVWLPTLDTSALLLEQHQLSGPDCHVMCLDGPDLDFSFDALPTFD